MTGFFKKSYKNIRTKKPDAHLGIWFFVFGRKELEPSKSNLPAAGWAAPVSTALLPYNLSFGQIGSESLSPYQVRIPFGYPDFCFLKAKGSTILWGMVLRSLWDYWIWTITRCADTGRVPPARGVMVSAAAVPSGFLTVRTELMTVVSTIAIPTI